MDLGRTSVLMRRGKFGHGHMENTTWPGREQSDAAASRGLLASIRNQEDARSSSLLQRLEEARPYQHLILDVQLDRSETKAPS